MKKIMKENLLKSVLLTTAIALALTSLVILLHTCIATKANQKYLDAVNNCIKNDIGCEKEWEIDITEDAKNYEDHWVNDYNKLKERYSNEYQASSYWNRKTHYECSIIWFTFYRELVLFNTALGIIIGIILHFVFKNQKIKKKRN